jgi:DNA-binding PadR family transcriptional regulator
VSSGNGAFFCFPLCLLALPADDHKRRLQTILSAAMERAGMGAEIESQRIREYIAENEQHGYNRSEAHNAILRGAIVCGVQVHNLPHIVDECGQCRTFVKQHEATYGAGPLVFISTELFWGCHNQDSPPYRDFTVLCAVNSIIGFKKTPVLVRRGMILARQIGFKTPAVMTAELPKRKDQTPLTMQQLRDALDRLESRGLISRCQASRRNVYFSTTTAWEDLQKSVKELVAQKRRIQLRREVDRATVQNQNGTTQEPQENHLKRNQAKQPEKEPLKNGEPERNHNGTTREPQPEPLKEVSEISAFKEVSQTSVASTARANGNKQDGNLPPEMKERWERLKRDL